MRKILLLAVAVFCLNSVARADSYTVIGSRAAQNPTDIIDWTQLGPALTVLPTPQFVTTFNGNSALVANISTGNPSFNRVDEGNGWVGNFDFGESLVWTGAGANGTNGTGPGPFLIEFNPATPVGSFGFSIQADLYGAFTATVTAINCDSSTFTQTFSGTSNGNEDGSAIFVGIGDTSRGNICGIVIQTDSPGFPTWANDFAIDDVSLTYGAFSTPEPGSLLLLGSGLLGLAGIRRRKLSV